MDIQDKLKRDYENKSIYTAGFYADPDNDLANRKKLFDVLKSLVENQEAIAAAGTPPSAAPCSAGCGSGPAGQIGRAHV